MAFRHFAAASSLAVLLLVNAAPAEAGGIGVFRMYNSNNGRCLDFAARDPNQINAPFGTLQQWSCGGSTAYNQQWNWIPMGSYPNGSPSYVFQNLNNATCIAVENDSLANAARIVERVCDFSNPSQHWIQLTRDLPGKETKWMNGRSGKCLDIWNNNNGTVFQQYDCAKANIWPQQMFRGQLMGPGI